MVFDCFERHCSWIVHAWESKKERRRSDVSGIAGLAASEGIHGVNVLSARPFHRFKQMMLKDIVDDTHRIVNRYGLHAMITP
jgi:hypothetical protein